MDSFAKLKTGYGRFVDPDLYPPLPFPENRRGNPPRGHLWWRKCPECGSHCKAKWVEYPLTLNSYANGHIYWCKKCKYQYIDVKRDFAGD